jgi:PHD/YefM family antitoxin component YafN of YafNO toxin-antitoxin module
METTDVNSASNGYTSTYLYKDASALVSIVSDSFMVRDVRGLVPYRPVAEIVILRSYSEKQGHASKVLDQIISDHKDYVILVKAAPMLDPEVIGSDKYVEVLKELVRFYEHHNFASINDIIGYENGEAMCYRNEAYEELMEALNNFRKGSK